MTRWQILAALAAALIAGLGWWFLKAPPDLVTASESGQGAQSQELARSLQGELSADPPGIQRAELSNGEGDLNGDRQGEAADSASPEPATELVAAPPAPSVEYTPPPPETFALKYADRSLQQLVEARDTLLASTLAQQRALLTAKREAGDFTVMPLVSVGATDPATGQPIVGLSAPDPRIASLQWSLPDGNMGCASIQPLEHPEIYDASAEVHWLSHQILKRSGH
jgi:hypothetical protein